MKRPVFRPSGYTLVEILVATTLSLILLGAVVQMFGNVGRSITDSRSMLEMSDHLRMAAMRLQQDLAGATVTMSPPRRPEKNEGYFEYIEGPVGVVAGAQPVAWNTDTAAADTTVGDFDDILMFTTRSAGRPFVGRYGASTIQSDVAEVAWFIRGRTLYRRVLLVAPSASLGAIVAPYYANCDISARLDGGGNLVANTLGDLTKRECRYAHQGTFPFDVTNWGQSGLPTLRECCYSKATFLWTVGRAPPAGITARAQTDFWSNNPGLRLADNYLTTLIDTGYNPATDLQYESRIADDVILTNVIGFDVKAWDPDVGTGQYVDLGYVGVGRFAGNGAVVGYTQGGVGGYTAQALPRVYDTWSTHYEDVGTWVGDPRAGRANNGFDDAISETGAATNGLVDDDQEKLTHPPYPYPLRGIQVKIRVFEPDSRQIREWTVVQDFLAQ